jgi:hypothetical protein
VADRVRRALDAADQAQRNADRTSGGLDLTAMQLTAEKAANAELRTKMGRYQVVLTVVAVAASALAGYVILDRAQPDFLHGDDR